MQKRPAQRPTTEPDSTPTRTAAAEPGDPGRLQQQAHQICPGCGALMVDRGCKVRCLRCGFFLDCSDG
ncbi:MAG TPA: hypothetical protein PLW65_18535 [Pseudomonadota bacterium]|nr:hypothetical protein [Pseudomonadota bacterium]